MYFWMSYIELSGSFVSMLIYLLLVALIMVFLLFFYILFSFFFFFFSSRRRHTRSYGDWSSDVCSSDLDRPRHAGAGPLLRIDSGEHHVWRRSRIGGERRVGSAVRECPRFHRGHAEGI